LQYTANPSSIEEMRDHSHILLFDIKDKRCNRETIRYSSLIQLDATTLELRKNSQTV
jgi:hypothetical protein